MRDLFPIVFLVLISMKQLQAHFLIFVRMKLSRIEVVLADCRGEVFSVSSAGGNDCGMDWLGKVAMDEIDIAAARNALEEGTVTLNYLDLIPSDLRNLQAGVVRKPNHSPAEDSQTGGTTIELFALLEQSLVAD